METPRPYSRLRRLGWFTLGLLTWKVAYQKYWSAKSEIYFQPMALNQEFDEKAYHIKKFVPSAFVAGAWPQILWLRFIKPDLNLNLPYVRDIIPLSDGGQMSVDWLNWPEEEAPKGVRTKVVLVWVGIGGCSDRAYIKYLVDFLCKSENNLDSRYVCGVLHPRGGGNTELTTPRMFDFLRDSDMEEAVDYCVKKIGADPHIQESNNLYGVGVSIGANLLLNYCARKGKDAPFRALISFNNPWDMLLAQTMMKGSLFEKFMVSGIIDTYFLRQRKSWTDEKNKKRNVARISKKKELTEEDLNIGITDDEAKVFQEIREKYQLDFKTLLRTNKFEELDSEMTHKMLVRSPFQSYPPDSDQHQTWKSSITEYHYYASSMLSIPEIKIPTMVVQSKNDPIINFNCMPLDSCKDNPLFYTVITGRGGHFQYFQGDSHLPSLKEKAPWKDRAIGFFFPTGRWVGKVTKEYIDFIEGKQDKDLPQFQD